MALRSTPVASDLASVAGHAAGHPSRPAGCGSALGAGASGGAAPEAGPPATAKTSQRLTAGSATSQGIRYPPPLDTNPVPLRLPKLQAALTLLKPSFFASQHGNVTLLLRLVGSMQTPTAFVITCCKHGCLACAQLQFQSRNSEKRRRTTSGKSSAA